VFSSLGGNLVHAKLREKQFLDDPKDVNSGHDVVRATDAADAAYRIAFEQGVPTPPDGAWEASQPAPDAVTFAADVGNVHIEKRYRVDKARYRLQLEIAVANRGEAAVGSTMILSIGGRQDPDKRPGGIFSAVSANPATALCYANGKVLSRADREPGQGPDPDGQGARQHLLDRDRREVLPARRRPDAGAEPRVRLARDGHRRRAGDAALRRSGSSPRRRGRLSRSRVFAGPKVMDELEVGAAAWPRAGTTARPAEVNLDKAVDVTLRSWRGRSLSLLKFFHASPTTGASRSSC
jgi:hypothetical protein